LILTFGGIYLSTQKFLNFCELEKIDGVVCFLRAYEWRYKEYEKIGDFKKAKADKKKIKDLKNNDGVVISYVNPIGGD